MGSGKKKTMTMKRIRRSKRKSRTTAKGGERVGKAGKEEILVWTTTAKGGEKQ